MAHPTTATTIAFVLVVALVYALLVAAVVRGDLPRAERVRLLGGVLMANLLVPGGLAAIGALDSYTLPPPSLLLVVALTIATVAIAWSPIGARLASRLPMAALVGYQAFRIPVELILHRLYRETVIPVAMTFEGGHFDIVTGALAIVLAAFLSTGRMAGRYVRAWNLFGLFWLGNIVYVAVLSMPTPFRQYFDGPPNTLPGMFPYVWLPSFLVQAALFGHLLVFRAQRAGR